ncbi:MAG: D-glycerate dehydrogenase, partial [Chloroflexi bacterium]|nr:D-glycerate dehydrogenase [Chloroflexota bacterium]
APRELESELSVGFVSLDEVLETSDIVSLHLPLSSETKGLIGRRELALMQRHAILLNTARGPLIDEAALIGALESGQIAGAGLDVFDSEPPDPSNRLLHLENVVLTPHISAGTRDAFITKMQAAFANMRRVAAGEPPFNQVSSREAGGRPT